MATVASTLVDYQFKEAARAHHVEWHRLLTRLLDFEALVRQKNLLAQQQSGPGEGFILAEFGTLDVYSVNGFISGDSLKDT